MAALSNKKLEKTTKIRIALVFIIVVADILLLPWLLKFPFFLVEDFVKAPGRWIDYGIFKSIKDVFVDHNYRNLFLVMQLPILALIIGVSWNVNRFKKKNRIKDGVGGPEPSGYGQHGTSRWQTKKEMDKSATVWYSDKPIKKAGVVFGMEKDRRGREKIWLDDDDTHSLTIGATRCGKGRKQYLPSIWTFAKAGESMVVGDPKGELYISTKEYLEKEGYNVIALNLREPEKGNQWNILDPAIRAYEEGNKAKTIECAWDIASTIINKETATNTEPIWINGAQSVVAALILLTVFESDFKFQKHMTTVYYLLAELGAPLEDGTVPINELMDSLPTRHPAKDAFATAKMAAYKTRSSFFTSVLTDLRLFSDPNVSDMTSKMDHDLEKIGIEKTAVFLIVPDEKSTRHVLATLYIDQLYQALVDLANRNGGRIPRRVEFLLDEFGNLPPIPNFDKKLTVAGGRGMRFNIVVQDVAQLKKLYKQSSQTITGNCHNWIYIRTSDMETAKLISGRTGQYTVETENSSSSIQSRGHSLSHGVGLTGRALLLPDEVTRWDNNESLILRTGEFPARYPFPDLSQYRANRDFGFVDPSGDVEKDKKLNAEIIMKRWQNVTTREVEEVSIWLPEIIVEDKDEEKETQNLEKNIINPNKEVAYTKEDPEKNTQEKRKINKNKDANDEGNEKPIENLDDILKKVVETNDEDDTDEDDFL